MDAGSHNGFVLANLRLPTKCNCRSQLGPQIYTFGDIVIFIFRRFGLKLPIYAHFGGVLGHTSPNVVTHRSNPQHVV